MKLTLEELQNIETEMLKEVVEICEGNNIEYYLAYGSVLGAQRHVGPIPWDDDVDIIIPLSQISKFVEFARKELSNKFFVDYYDTNKSSIILFPRIGLKGYSTKILHIDVFKMIGAPSDKNEQAVFKRKLNYFKNRIQYKNLSEGYFSFDKISWKAKLMIYAKAFQMIFIRKKQLIAQFETLCRKYPLDSSKITTNATGGYGLKEFIPRKFYGKGKTKKYVDFSIRVPEYYKDYLHHFYGNYEHFPPENECNTNKTYFIKQTF